MVSNIQNLNMGKAWKHELPFGFLKKKSPQKAYKFSFSNICN